MTVLIIGVPDSGKSIKAEEKAVELAENGRKIYIATMIPYGEEGQTRVEKHKKLRDGKGFETIEQPVKIGELAEKDFRIEASTCLLECMSNLIGNEMHSDENISMSEEDLTEYIVASVKALADKAKHLVIVSNSFPLDGEGYDEDTKKYTALVNTVNRELKNIADEVHEYVDERWNRI